MFRQYFSCRWPRSYGTIEEIQNTIKQNVRSKYSFFLFYVFLKLILLCIILENFFYCNHILNAKQSLQNDSYNVTKCRRTCPVYKYYVLLPRAFILDCVIPPATDIQLYWNEVRFNKHSEYWKKQNTRRTSLFLKMLAFVFFWNLHCYKTQM